MIIDTQVHIFRYVRMGRNRSFTGDYLVSQMDLAGVDRAILISYEARDIMPDLKSADDIDVDKEYFISAWQKHPDRFVWFTDHIDPKVEGYMAAVERDVERGATGIKLFPAYVDVLPDDPRFLPLYEFCARRKLPIIMAFERWNDPRLGAYVRDYAEFLGHFEPIARDFPTVRFLLTHWGCTTWGEGREENQRPPYPRLKHLVDLMQKHDNLSTDLAAISFIFPGEYPYPMALDFVKELVGRLGAERVMWGTDFPWSEGRCEYRKTVTMLTEEAKFLTEREKSLIMGENAARFLGL